MYLLFWVSYKDVQSMFILVDIRKYSLCNIRENVLGPVYNNIMKLLVVLVIGLFC